MSWPGLNPNFPSKERNLAQGFDGVFGLDRTAPDSSENFVTVFLLPKERQEVTAVTLIFVVEVTMEVLVVSTEVPTKYFVWEVLERLPLRTLFPKTISTLTAKAVAESMLSLQVAVDLILKTVTDFMRYRGALVIAICSTQKSAIPLAVIMSETFFESVQFSASIICFATWSNARMKHKGSME